MKYDAIVIGSGQGGNPLSRQLADRGRHVALVERKHLGGTCINKGCTPTKTMVASAQVAHYARNGVRWGVRGGRVVVDLAKVVGRNNAVVEQFRSGQQKQVESRPNLRLDRGTRRSSLPMRSGSVKKSSRARRSSSTRARAPTFRRFRDSTTSATSPTPPSWS
jgi:pyruvate/2-oxoglutarate dehydrogenase complex dihydrolipoamide dehydrogenase (E3) component